MFYLFLYFRYNNKFYKKIILGLLLSIINNIISLLLTLISGSLLTYTFLSGINNTYYNYIVPTIMIRIITIIKIIIQYFEKIIQHNNTLYFLNNLRILIFNKIFPLYPSNLTTIFNIKILNMLISDIENLDFLYIKVFIPIIVISIITIIVLIYLIITNFIFFIILNITILFLIVFYFFYFYQKGKIIGKKYLLLKEKYYFYLNNFILQHTEYKIFQGIKFISYKINNLEKKFKTIQLKKHYYDIKSKLLMNIIISINILIILFLFYKNQNILKYQIIFFILFFITYYKILFPLHNIFQNMHEIFLSAKKIFYLIEKKPKIIFKKKYVKKNHYFYVLKIHNLSFYFKRKNPYILKNLFLNVKKYQKVAITGHNGSGKSTLFMLLTRAWNPIKGKIYLNEDNLKNWSLNLLRNNISVMTQKIYLFSDTLRNNILLNNQNNKNINDVYLKKILKLVGLEQLLNNKGLNTWMGDGGRLLSGGELKKLGIARIIIHNGNLLLLDEPTEGLDKNSSIKIINLILSIFKKKTIIIITHNINILKKVNYIYLMDNGSIIEKGKHNNLINKNKYYCNYIKNNIIIK
ncbi:ATP-binding cassette domain-containing protein [Enterobacteriaceae endosymbiont of Donacia provostii]|uniref:ATP-binding cassette domain-containing protein n=1 Tax=Enterobacteriaceae endosymbiont of Donacia provostii TaxID=2675781 RepID=UPI00144A0870|nr:ATP-binding cassette domain-containing protein [Enterobacteriaceae endosymbiont of Donacia provostii]QJC33892.1 ATP-binding cassette domain-containing protein [Enterobacteriaceae endosymbiont of Donacia provostii]